MAVSNNPFPVSGSSTGTPSGAIASQSSKTLSILRSIGYALLLLSLVDLLYVVLPLELTNPVWEYQTIGDVVKLVPVLMLALMLLFLGETTSRHKPERQILRLLSWFSLIIGILFLLLIPLIVSDTIRISRFNNQQISTQVNQQKLQLDTTRQQLEQATPEQLQSLVPVPDAKGQLPNAPSTPEEAKAQLLTNLKQAQEQANTQAQQARNNLRQNLLKNTAKLIAESLIGGLIFIYLWSMTSWCRRPGAYGYEVSSPSPTTGLANLPQKLTQLFQRQPRRRR